MSSGEIKSKPVYWRNAILSAKANLREVIDCMNRSSLKIVLVVDNEDEIQGTISDGDIRRGLLRGLSLDDPIDSIVHRNALVVPPNIGRDMVLQLMLINRIQQIPIVDDQQRIIGLHVWDEILPTPVRPNRMIIMAGGKGTRLRPFTESCPKPLVMIAGKPMLEHIIERAKLEGFSDFILAVHYLGHMIEDYFGDGNKLSVRIDYLNEDNPLGTAGALSLLDTRPKEAFVVTNGDVLTDIRYGDLIDFHNKYNAHATMAVRSYDWQHPFGVVQTRGAEIIGLEEKPITRTHINAGVYVLSPNVLDQLERGVACDMPSLFNRLQELQLKTVAYPMHEPWLDVGMPADLERAYDAVCNTPSINKDLK
jgi:dTDP-glucose pyrophosphorylase